jgi:hypothetical protein
MAAFLAILGLVPLSNLLTDQTPDPWWNGAVIHWAILTLIVLGLAYALAATLGTRLDGWYAVLEDRVMAIPPLAFGLGCAALASTLAAVNSIIAFHRHWVSADEALAMWHGRMLLAGRLWVPADADAQFFASVGTGVGDRWYSVYSIGGPALMAAGDAVHARWLIGPICTGIAVYAFYRFAAPAFGERVARGTTLLLSLCGYLVMMGATSMNHTQSLALIMAALAGLAAWANAESHVGAYLSAALVGACVASVVAFRPYDAVLAGIVIGGFQLTALRASPWRARSLAVQVLAGLIPLSLVLAANASMTGHPLEFAYDAINGAGHDPGFHVSPTGFEHTPLRGLMIASSYLMLMNRALLYTPIPALLLVCAGLLAMRRVTRWDALVYVMTLAFIAGYAAYWFDGTMFGPRFLYAVVPLFVLLVARAPSLVGARLGGTATRAAILVLPICLAYAWLIPGARFGLLANIASQRRGRGDHPIDVARMLEETRTHRALVFVPTVWAQRQFARMRALRLDLSSTEQVAGFADACDLERALAREEGTRAEPADHLRRIVSATAAPEAAPIREEPLAAGQVRLRRMDALPPECAAELAADSVPYALFEQFMPFFTFDRDGRLTGDVIFAHDMGVLRNERLRARFGDRTWYQFRRANVPGGGVLVPYPTRATGTGSANSP